MDRIKSLKGMCRPRLAAGSQFASQSCPTNLFYHKIVDVGDPNLMIMSGHEQSVMSLSHKRPRPQEYHEPCCPYHEMRSAASRTVKPKIALYKPNSYFNSHRDGEQTIKNKTKTASPRTVGNWPLPFIPVTMNQKPYTGSNVKDDKFATVVESQSQVLIDEYPDNEYAITD